MSNLNKKQWITKCIYEWSDHWTKLGVWFHQREHCCTKVAQNFGSYQSRTKNWVDRWSNQRDLVAQWSN